MKILICIVAYEAAKHIADVLQRIPPEIWSDPNYHVLISDDASTDGTDRLVQEAVARLGHPATIQTIFTNQGYGGNQKLCYDLAIRRGFDGVILLHGDGQYPAEMLGEFIQRLNAGADVVLGSRFLTPGGPRGGGMPNYKIVGNKFLTRLQNWLCRSKLSEFHTGYRGYSVKFLRNIPFHLNSYGFHFDTEILLQGMHVGARFEEFPIPTFYGDEICRVPGIRYSLAVLRESFRYRLRLYGALSSLKYPRTSNQIYDNRTSDPFSVNGVVLSALRANKNLEGRPEILDIGSGQGHLARELHSSFNITTLDKEELHHDFEHSHIEMDLDVDPWTIDISEYDYILMLDIIEHLNNPEQFMISLKQSGQSNEPPTIFLSTPNVAFVLMRLGLLLGRFNYSDRGILDVTHRRLFTLTSLQNMLIETGFEISDVKGIGPPILPFGRGRVMYALAKLGTLLARVYPRLFAFQFLLKLKPRKVNYKEIDL